MSKKTPMNEWPSDYEISSQKTRENGEVVDLCLWAHTPGLRDAAIAVLTREGRANIVWQERERVHPETWNSRYTSEAAVLSRATEEELARLSDKELGFL